MWIVIGIVLLWSVVGFAVFAWLLGSEIIDEPSKWGVLVGGPIVWVLAGLGWLIAKWSSA